MHSQYFNTLYCHLIFKLYPINIMSWSLANISSHENLRSTQNQLSINLNIF